MKSLALALSFMLLPACGVSFKYKPVSVRELVPVGSTVRLTRAIEVPPNHAYVYIAGGKVAPFKNYNTVDVRKPYCRIGFTRPAASARRINPDSFRITKIVEWEDYHGSIDSPRWASLDKAGVAISGGVRLGGFNYNDGGPSIIMYATIMSLRSNNQPGIREMVCGHWDEQGTVEPLTLAQLRSALGNLIVIDIVGPSKS